MTMQGCTCKKSEERLEIKAIQNDRRENTQYDYQSSQ